jgi:sugar/nucleoside kinase (ribokinase family)
LRDHGVDTTYVHQVRGQHTYFCIVQLDDTGEKVLTGAETGIKVPPADSITDDLLASSALVHPLADDINWTTDIALRAHALGTQVAIDLEAAAFSGGLDVLSDLLAVSDIVFTNRIALEQADLGDPGASLTRLLAYGPQVVVATLGADGAVARTADRQMTVSAAPLKARRPVDTTGAGDSFNGAFCAGYIRGEPLVTCLRRGSAIAAMCVGTVGSHSYVVTDNTLVESMAAVEVSSHAITTQATSLAKPSLLLPGDYPGACTSQSR